MQVKDIHAAAGELPAQLDLKRMPHVVVDDDSERALSLPRIGLGLEPDSRGEGLRVVARDVTHAAAVSRASLQRPRDCVPPGPGRDSFEPRFYSPRDQPFNRDAGWPFTRPSERNERLRLASVLYIRSQRAILLEMVFGPASS